MELKKTTNTADLFALLDHLDAHNVPVLLHGGWALDALTGTVKDSHHDVDLLVHERHRRALVRLFAGETMKDAGYKLKLNFRGTLVDLVFYRLNRAGEPVTASPGTLVRWHPELLQGVTAPLAGRQVPVIGATAMYAELATPKPRKPELVASNRRDMDRLEPLLTDDQKTDARRYVDEKCTRWQMWLLKLGLR